LEQITLPPFAKVVDFVKCEGKDHLKRFNDSILAKGGEGVMLREAGSLYKAGRSTSLRKYKPFVDTEVRVVKNQYPHGFICEQYFVVIVSG
jgi:DNA ligase-1